MTAVVYLAKNVTNKWQKSDKTAKI